MLVRSTQPTDINVKTTYYSDDVITGTYELGLTVSFDEDGRIEDIVEFDATPPVAGLLSANDIEVPEDVRVKTWDGNVVTIGNDAGFELKVRVTNLDGNNPRAGVAIKATIDLVGFGAMDMEIGANEGQELPIRIPNISLENMELSAANLRTQEESSEDRKSVV